MRRFPITESFTLHQHFAKQFELEILEIDNIPLFNDLKWIENFQLRLPYNKITLTASLFLHARSTTTPSHLRWSVIEWLSTTCVHWRTSLLSDCWRFLLRLELRASVSAQI